MQFLIDDAFFELFPEAMIGIVVARGLDNLADAEPIAELLLARIAATAAELGEAEIGSLPAVAPWRAAYQAFGVKPSKFRSGLENLLRSAKSGRLRPVNPLVDLYNIVSLTHRLPCGGEDMAAVVGDIRLTRAVGGERFVPLGGTVDEPPAAGVVIYRDDVGAICSCWNWREADRTKLTDTTADAFLVIEALPPTSADGLRAACDDLAAAVTGHLGGTAAVHLLDRTRPTLAFDAARP
ncbi:MAG: B3/B4 domain-containing protein [Thermomicrobiales bacterium]